MRRWQPLLRPYWVCFVIIICEYHHFYSDWLAGAIRWMVCPLEPSWLLSHRTALARGSFTGDVYHYDVWSSRQTWYCFDSWTQPWKGLLRPYGQPAIVNNLWEGKMMLIRSLLNPGESKNCWCKNLRLQRSFSFGWSKSRQTGYIG